MSDNAIDNDNITKLAARCGEAEGRAQSGQEKGRGNYPREQSVQVETLFSFLLASEHNEPSQYDRRRYANDTNHRCIHRHSPSAASPKT